MIDEADLRIDVYRQAIYHGDVTVRITHEPTGWVATATDSAYGGYGGSSLVAKRRALADLEEILADKGSANDE